MHPTSPTSPRRPRFGLPAYVALGGFLFVSQLGGCSCDEEVGTTPMVGTGFDKFTVNPPPELVNNPLLPVSGTSNQGTTVWSELNSGAPTLLAQVSAFGDTWTGNLTLQEGPNTMVFHPRNAAGTEGTRSDTFTVTLDTTAPGMPALDGEVPACVPQGSYTLAGSAEPGSTVTANGMTVETDAEGKFEVTINVTGNGSSVSITATDAAGNTSEPNVVQLTAGLAAPTIDNLVSPTNEATQTLMGTKASGASVVIIYEDGTEEVLASASGDTTWSAEVTFADGVTNFELEGRTSAGEPSCGRNPYTVVVSDVCPVTVDDSNFPTHTNNPILAVLGTKCEGTAVHAFRGDQTFADSIQYVPLNNDTSFAFNYNLVEGENVFYVILKDSNNLPGPSDGPFTVILDTQRPNPPLYVPDPPASTLETTIRLTGTKDANTNVCLRVDAQEDCTVVFPRSAGTDFAFNHTLHPELNFLCISSFDEAGNQSEETCATVEQGAGSGVQIVAPLNGSIIGDAPFGSVVLAQEEGEIPAARVSICLDSACVDATAAGGIQWEATLTAPNTFENGSVHTVSATGYRTNGSAFGMAQVTVVYIVDGLLLSDSDPEEASARPRIALDGEGIVHVVWADNCSQSDDCTDSAPGNLPADIFHRSFEEGQWSPITLVSEGQGDGDSRNPSLVTDEDGDLHVIWEDNGNIQGAGGDFDLIHRSYDAARGRWGDVSVATDNDLEDLFSDVAAGGGKVHVTWHARTEEDNSSDIDVFYRAYDLAAGTWGATLKLSDQAGNMRSEQAAVAVDSTGRAWVAWQENGNLTLFNNGTDRDIILRSVNSAGVAGAPILVSDNNLDGSSSQVDVLVDNNDQVHVVWQDTASVAASGADLDIYQRSYDANGVAMPTPYALVSNEVDEIPSRSPALALNPETNEVFIAWVQGATDEEDVYYVRGVDGVFGGLQQVSGSAFNLTSEAPDLLYDPVTKILHVVWEDETTVGTDGEDRDVFYLGIPLE